MSDPVPDSTLRPFTIDVDLEALADLRHRIESARWPESETVDDWSQGVPLAYLRELASYWVEEYDWSAAAERMNQFDHFVTEIDGLDIHYIHQPSPHADATPLVITHGWPGSVVEFMDIIDPLVNPTEHGGRAEDAFHVVCPSLPGYGFSGKPATTGWSVERIARAWDELMSRLGYARYGAQGGDWGGAVTTQLGRIGGQGEGNCVAIHTNMPLGQPTDAAKSDPDARDLEAFRGAQFYREWDSGYSKQQSTRPQTLGYGLVDSPIGQLAWIVEKFWAWTDCGEGNDRHPERALTKAQMLDNVMLYWLTATGASSARLYWESFGNMAGNGRVEVPTGVASFPAEIVRSPRSWCEAMYDIVHWTDMDRGGHFAAFEQPELLVADMRTFFSGQRERFDG